MNCTLKSPIKSQPGSKVGKITKRNETDLNRQDATLDEYKIENLE